MNRQAIDFTDTNLLTLSLRNLRSIAVIASEGSVTAAARRLGFSQATLSAHLAAVESALSVRIFERHGRGIALTEIGRIIVRRIGNVFAAFESLRDDAGGAHRTIVSIGATSPTLPRLLPLLHRIERKHPDLQIELRVETATEIAHLLDVGDIEVGVAASSGRSSANVLFERLPSQQLVLLVPASHSLASRRFVELKQLRGETVLLGEDPCLYRRIVERSLDDADVEVIVRARFGALSTLPQAVSAGFGVAIVPQEFAVTAPPNTTSIRLRNPITVTIGLLTRRSASEPARRIAAEVRAALSQDEDPRPARRGNRNRRATRSK